MLGSFVKTLAETKNPENTNPNNRDYMFLPECINRNANIQVEDVFMGFKHNLFLTRDGYLYGAGDNSRKQMNFEDGTENKHETHLKKIIIPNEPDCKFKKAGLGCEYSLLLTHDNRLFSR